MVSTGSLVVPLGHAGLAEDVSTVVLALSILLPCLEAPKLGQLLLSQVRPSSEHSTIPDTPICKRGVVTFDDLFH